MDLGLGGEIVVVLLCVCVCVRCNGEIEMCRIERNKWTLKSSMVMGLKALGESKVEKLKSSMVSPRSKMKLWMIRAMTSILLWTCIVQLTALGETWGPRVLKGWPSCFTQESASVDAFGIPNKPVPVPPKIVLPPKSKFFYGGS